MMSWMAPKPIMEQIGPYTYRETRNKENVTFLSDDEEISYTSPQLFVFDPEMSVGDPTKDSITTINIPFLTVVNTVSGSTFEEVLVGAAAETVGSKVFESYKISELLWGYEDPLLTYLKKLKPSLIPTTFFGLFAGKNDSYDGVYVVDSGKNDSARTSTIDTYNGNSSLTYWSTDTANMINGTDGTYYHPFINTDEPIYVFSSDICRSIMTTYEKNIDVKGVEAKRFVGPPEVFQNVTTNPDNVGFCTPDEDHCLPGGLLNVSNCHLGAPVVMSLPHFLYSDQSVFDMVEGDISPKKEEHQTSFDLEPTTGGPVQVFKRLQINVLMKSYEKPEVFKSLPTAYLPILWLNESSTVPQDYADQLQWMTNKLHLAVEIVQWSFIAISLLLFFVLIVWLMSEKRPSGELAQPINEPSENSPLLGSKA